MSKKNMISHRFKNPNIGLISKDWSLFKLEDIGEFYKGAGIVKSDLKEKGIPCLRYGEIYTNHNYYIKKFYSFIDKTTAQKSKLIKKGDILFAGSGETREDIGKCVAYINNFKAYAGGDVIIFRPEKQYPKYLGFLLNHEIVNRQKYKLGQGYSIVHIYPYNLKKILVPIPSLSEQKKIAKILTTWDEAIDKTEKLMELKKKVKKGFMQQFLTKKRKKLGVHNCRIFKLGEISNIKTGDKDNKDKVKNGSYPFFVRSDNIERINSYSYDGEAILIPGDGRIGEIFHYIKGKFNYHQRVYRISHFGKIVVGKYIYYYLQQNFLKEAIKHSVKATVDSLRLPTFTQMKIELPTKEYQILIANILSAIDKEIELLNKKIEVYKQQKKGLMQKLLTGKVRVKV